MCDAQRAMRNNQSMFLEWPCGASVICKTQLVDFKYFVQTCFSVLTEIESVAALAGL